MVLNNCSMSSPMQVTNDCPRLRAAICRFKTGGLLVHRTKEEQHGSTTIGERGASPRHRVEGSHCAHRDLEGAGALPLSGRSVESRRRRSRRPGRLELLRKLVPKAATVGVLVNPSNPEHERSIATLRMRRMLSATAHHFKCPRGGATPNGAARSETRL